MSLSRKKIISVLTERLEADPNVSFGLLFGSLVKKPLSKARDIDVAVFFHHPPDGLDLLKYIDSLGSELPRELDLVTFNQTGPRQAGPFLRQRILQTGTLLVEKDHALFRDERGRALDDAEDERYLRDESDGR